MSSVCLCSKAVGVCCCGDDHNKKHSKAFGVLGHCSSTFYTFMYWTYVYIVLQGHSSRLVHLITHMYCNKYYCHTCMVACYMIQFQHNFFRKKTLVCPVPNVRETFFIVAYCSSVIAVY